MMNNHKYYLIAETAFHHMGEIGYLKKLIDEASVLKINALKVHMLLDLHDYMISEHDAFSTLSNWLFSENEWHEILNYVNQRNMDPIVMCNDEKSIDFILKNFPNIPAIELHATGLNDYFLLSKASKFKGEVILGVGGSSIDELQFAVDFLFSKGKNEIFFMYGFQNYPTNYEDINLNKIKKIKDLFGLPIGYADHTNPGDPMNSYVTSLAYGLGVRVFEKHLAIQKTDRVDSQAAVNSETIKQLQNYLKIAEKAFGNGSLKMSEAEEKYGNTGVMKKAIVARKEIQKGETLTLENLAFKRTNKSAYLKQFRFPELLGLKAKQEIKTDEIIDFSNVEFEFKVGDFSAFKKDN